MGPVGEKDSLVQLLATGWEGWWTSVQRLTPHPAPDKQGVRAFIDSVCGGPGGRGADYMQK